MLNVRLRCAEPPGEELTVRRAGPLHNFHRPRGPPGDFDAVAAAAALGLPRGASERTAGGEV